MTNKDFVYNSGAKRKQLLPFYGGIPFAALQRMGEAFATGRDTYDENLWERNWHKGDAKFFVDTYDHVIEHLAKWREEIETGVIYDGDEDHLGHALAEIAMLCWAAQRGIIPDKTTQFVPVFSSPGEQAQAESPVEEQKEDVPAKKENLAIRTLNNLLKKG